MVISGDIDEKVAEAVISQMDDNTPRKITINSVGGDVASALAIYDAIVGKGVTVVGTGLVASAAVVILLGGDKRYCTKHTRFMTHTVSLQVEEGDDPPSDVEINETVIACKTIAKIIDERTNVGQAESERLLIGDNYFGADEAIAMGFVHGLWRDVSHPKGGVLALDSK